MTDNEKIAMLTTGALKTTMESAVKAMIAAVEAAEEKTKELREATEQFISDFEKVTANLSDNVNSHVMACQSAIDTFQAHHLKILNIDEPEDNANKIQLGRVENEISKLRALAPAAAK